MKKRILTIASILFLAIMIPLTVNAATISAEPKEMKVGDIVTVTVEVETANTESVQFDLDFDATKYKYVLNSATSELDSTGSNLLDTDTVRVVAFKFDDNTTAQNVKLQFEAIASGKSVPFEVVDGSLEASVFDQANARIVSTPETFTEPTAFVSKIEPNPEKDVKDPQYFDKDGNPITKHKPTGDVTRATATKSIAGVYTKLITGKLVVPYALPTSDDTLTVEDIKAEFGSTVDVTGLTNPVKSGDKFILNGQEHIVLIYGDVNKDGKVTAADALITRKYELNVLTPDEVTAITSEVGDTIEDSKAIQQFALRLRNTSTKTILEKYPVEFVASDFNFSYNSSIYRGEKSLIATISLKDSRTITSDILSAINIPNATVEVKDVNGTIEIYATPSNSNSFSIAPTLVNNNLENGKISEQPTTIAVKEVKSVTDIELFDEAGNKVTNSYSLISGDEQTFTIKYYHTYPDGTKIELDENNMTDNLIINSPNAISVSSPTILGSALLLDNDGVAGNLNFIKKLKLVSTLNKLGTENLTITIRNNTEYSSTQNYEALKTFPLDVNVANEEITGIKINGKVITSGEIDMNIYSAEPADFHLDDSDGDSYFTALKIELLTNKGNTKGVTPTILNDYYDESTAKDPNMVTICQISDREGSPELRVVPLSINTTTTKYEENIYANKESDAIGISYYDSYDQSISALSQGLEIYFGGTQKITVNVHAVDNRVSNTPSDPANNDGSNSFAPPVDHTENNMAAFSANIDVDAEDEKETKTTSNPSESPDASEITTPDNTPTAPTTPEVNPTPEVPDTSKEPETPESVD